MKNSMNTTNQEFQTKFRRGQIVWIGRKRLEIEDYVWHGVYSCRDAKAAGRTPTRAMRHLIHESRLSSVEPQPQDVKEGGV